MKDILLKYRPYCWPSLFFLWTIALFSSRALLSISYGIMAVWLLTEVFYLQIKYRITGVNIAILSFFGIFLISSTWSEHPLQALSFLTVKLPFLVIGLLVGNTGISEKATEKIRQLFILLIVVSATYTLTVYLSDINYWKMAYTRGTVLPTVLHHSVYSMMVVWAMLFLFQQRRKHPLIVAVLLAYLFIFLHLLAVKTGLLCLYIGIVLLIFSQLNKKTTLYSIPLLLAIGILLNYSTTIKHKIDYLKYDLQRINQADVFDYSDARRLISMKMAVEIVQEHPVFGVGIGDVHEAVKQQYIRHYQQYDREKMMFPHNTYLHIACAAGIVGLIIATCLFIYLFRWIKNQLYRISFCLLLLVCCWDALLEQQVGVALLLWLIVQYDNSRQLTKQHG